MRWSPQQDRALLEIREWYADRDAAPCFLLFGFAGVGKTEIAHAIGMDVSGVHFTAYTGKAVNVLRRRGCDPASTIHSTIYGHTFDAASGMYIRTLKPREALAGVRLFIMDEASMVNAQLARDLMSFRIKILVIADPMQLPPVDGEGWFMQFEPSVMLDEVHRQALDSPVLRLANDVRQGKWLWKKGRYGEVVISDRVHPRVACEHDVVLVGTNDSRRTWNRDLRLERGFIHASQSHREPQCDEVLVCLRNDYTVADEIFNGQLWRVHWVVHDTVRTSNGALIPILKLSLRNDEGRTEVRVDPRCFNGGADWRRGLQDFDFGYALTVHKAQGSEWDKVLVVNEGRAFPGWSRQWLYTAITRASKRLTIIDGS